MIQIVKHICKQFSLILEYTMFREKRITKLEKQQFNSSIQISF